MDGLGFDSVTSLSKLLEESKVERSADNQPPIAAAGSTVIVQRKDIVEKRAEEDSGKVTKNPGKMIWDFSDIPTEDSLLAATADERPCPKYEIRYPFVLKYFLDVYQCAFLRPPSATNKPLARRTLFWAWATRHHPPRIAHIW